MKIKGFTQFSPPQQATEGNFWESLKFFENACFILRSGL